MERVLTKIDQSYALQGQMGGGGGGGGGGFQHE